METYTVKTCGNSVHVILDKKRYKIGDKIQVISEESMSLNLLISDMEDLKNDIKKLKIVTNFDNLDITLTP